MRAVHIPSAGGQPTLADLPVPSPGAGEVLIGVHAAGLNPLDNAIAGGMLAEMMPHQYPLVLGRDVSGVAEAVGTDVAHVQVGDEVIGHVLLAPPLQAGTLAEYALVPGAAVTAKPTALDHVSAAALPLAGGAAQQAVDLIGGQAGQVVLVNGASGGVGRYAVQLLAQRGATVVATGTAVDFERLRALGAVAVVDYTAGPVAKQVRALYPDGVDALINLVGYTPEVVPLDALRAGGAVATTMPVPDADALAAAGLTGGMVVAAPTREVIAALADQVAAGTLQVDVQEVLPLDQTIAGLTDLAAGNAHGKIVVDLTR